MVKWFMYIWWIWIITVLSVDLELLFLLAGQRARHQFKNSQSVKIKAAEVKKPQQDPVKQLPLCWVNVTRFMLQWAHAAGLILAASGERQSQEKTKQNKKEIDKWPHYLCINPTTPRFTVSLFILSSFDWHACGNALYHTWRLDHCATAWRLRTRQCLNKLFDTPVSFRRNYSFRTVLVST